MTMMMTMVMLGIGQGKSWRSLAAFVCLADDGGGGGGQLAIKPAFNCGPTTFEKDTREEGKREESSLWLAADLCA